MNNLQLIHAFDQKRYISAQELAAKLDVSEGPSATMCATSMHRSTERPRSRCAVARDMSSPCMTERRWTRSLGRSGG